MLDLRPGDRINDRYQIITPLSSGGFGATYLAKDLKKYDERCVVKHLCPASGNCDDLKQRFNAEAQQLHRFGKFDQIPTLLAFEQQDRELYIIQEWVDGQDLSHELVWGTKRTEAQVIQLVREILTVLQILHHNLVIHRDLKPANIMRRRSDSRLVLIDFGFAKEITQSVYEGKQGKTTAAVSTLGYTAPEQLNGHPSLASDIYSVGAIAVQALTGRFPSELYDPQAGAMVWQNQVKVSDEFRGWLERVVDKPARDRYQNAQEALMALETMMGSSSTDSPTVKISPSASTAQSVPRNVKGSKLPRTVVNEPRSRRRFLSGLGLMGLGAVGFGVVGNLLQGTGKTEPTKINLKPKPAEKPQLEIVPQEPQSQIVTQGNRVLKSFPFETVQVDDIGMIKTRQSLQVDGFIEKLTSDVSLAMVKIPAGKFMMGSPASEKDMGSPASEKDSNSDERPQREVSVPEFYMGQAEITQAQWRSVSKFPKVNIDLNENPSTFKGDNSPVEQVNWWGAQEFCDRLSKYTGIRYRLPSEAEWEYACRSDTKTPFYFGETIDVDVANVDASYDEEDPMPGDFLYGYSQGQKGKTRNQTTGIATFPANAWGLYDMHGNVLEWCADHYIANYQGAPIDGSSRLSNNKNSSRSLRGGSWSSLPWLCRSADRNYNDPSFRNDNVGFRVVCRWSS